MGIIELSMKHFASAPRERTENHLFPGSPVLDTLETLLEKGSLLQNFRLENKRLRAACLESTSTRETVLCYQERQGGEEGKVYADVGTLRE